MTVQSRHLFRTVSAGMSRTLGMSERRSATRVPSPDPGLLHTTGLGLLPAQSSLYLDAASRVLSLAPPGSPWPLQALLSVSPHTPCACLPAPHTPNRRPGDPKLAPILPKGGMVRSDACPPVCQPFKGNLRVKSFLIRRARRGRNERQGSVTLGLKASQFGYF